MLQQIIRIGNSVGITFPAEYAKKNGLKPGKKVETTHDEATGTTIIYTGKKSKTSPLAPEFKKWLEEISTNEADTIKALAKA